MRAMEASVTATARSTAAGPSLTSSSCIDCLSLPGVRADQRHDQEERDRNQKIDSTTGDEADNAAGRRGRPNVFRERDRVPPAAPVQLEKAVSSCRTTVTQVRENELGGKRTLPDELVPLASRESPPAEIAEGRGTPTSLRRPRAAFLRQ